jgi:hypothetical protein
MQSLDYPPASMVDDDFRLEFSVNLTDCIGNTPATPLNDAQFGGYFFARIWR